MPGVKSTGTCDSMGRQLGETAIKDQIKKKVGMKKNCDHGNFKNMLRCAEQWC